MSFSVTFYLLIIFAYLIGSVPFGLLLGRVFADIDIRDHGSGNIGATNVNRVLGRKLGASTLLCDILKALGPTSLALFFLQDDILAAYVGLATIVGHCFPIFLKFRGGKGVATAFGTVSIVATIPAVIAFVVWMVVVRLTKISALGALVASISLPISVFLLEGSWELTIIVSVMVILVISRHKSNIQRLWSGKENSL